MIKMNRPLCTDVVRPPAGERTTVMKVFLAITLCVLSFLASAQEQQIIGGYLLDGKDSFEELDAAVVTDSKREDKNLDGKGMRLPGGAMMMIP